MAETVILYRNWRGETAVRTIILDTIAYGNEATGLGFGSNEWHPEEQWLLSAFDVEKGARRTFAMSGILAWGEAAIAARDAALAEAEAQGMRAGIESTKALADCLQDAIDDLHTIQKHFNVSACTERYERVVADYRALATAAPAETEERA